MTRTHKWTIHESRADPHYFTHNGFLNNSPNSTKKNGAGKGNWGQYGDELIDLADSNDINYKGLNRGLNAQVQEVKFKEIQKYEI
jgi:hypothetical protein